MANDLAATLMSGQNAGLMADPAYAAIAPQLQLGQALMSQGTSNAPAYPMQALSRLGQALAGSYVTADAQKQLGDMSAGATESLAKIFPAGTPMGDAVRSSSPLVRMIATQQAGHSLLLNSKYENVGPDHQLVAPATPQQGGGVVGQGSPALAGQVEAVKNRALIARAGGIKAAEAPNTLAGNVVVPGQNGPVSIPATMSTVNAMQPGGPQGVRPPQDETVVGPGPAAGLHLPGTAAPGSITGEPVKTPEFQGQVAANEKLYGGGNEALSKVIGGVIERGDQVARDKSNALDTMETALRAGGNSIVTGPLADKAMKAKQLLDGLGINSTDLTKGLPESEIVSKMNAQLSSAAAKAMTGRPTQAEFQIWMRNNPGLMTSKQGTLALINVLRQQTQQDMDLSKLAMDQGNWKNWGQVADTYFQGHGLINPLTNKPMREEIAAARAGPGGAQAPNPNATPAKAVPAVGQVVAGHQFMGGNPRDPNAWQIMKGDKLQQ